VSSSYVNGCGSIRSSMSSSGVDSTGSSMPGGSLFSVRSLILFSVKSSLPGIGLLPQSCPELFMSRLRLCASAYLRRGDRLRANPLGEPNKHLVCVMQTSLNRNR
jgi:hypothetical protein